MSYKIKLTFCGVLFADDKIENLHNLPAGQTTIHQFETYSPGIIQLEIARDIENDKKKNDKGREKEEGRGKEKSGGEKAADAADSDTVSDSRA